VSGGSTRQNRRLRIVATDSPVARETSTVQLSLGHRNCSFPKGSGNRLECEHRALAAAPRRNRQVPRTTRPWQRCRVRRRHVPTAGRTTADAEPITANRRRLCGVGRRVGLGFSTQSECRTGRSTAPSTCTRRAYRGRERILTGPIDGQETVPSFSNAVSPQL
jgi:hypothetical protein